MPYFKETGEHCGYFNRKDPKVGQSCCYPTSDYGFHNVCRIPEEVAREWVNQVGVQINRNHNTTEFFQGELPKGYSKYCNNQWLNKMMIVVDIGKYDLWITAVYNHDGRYYIIKREREL